MASLVGACVEVHGDDEEGEGEVEEDGDLVRSVVESAAEVEEVGGGRSRSSRYRLVPGHGSQRAIPADMDPRGHPSEGAVEGDDGGGGD